MKDYKPPNWWLHCVRRDHETVIDELDHRGGRYVGALEYFCSTCSRGETRGVTGSANGGTHLAAAAAGSESTDTLTNSAALSVRARETVIAEVVQEMQMAEGFWANYPELVERVHKWRLALIDALTSSSAGWPTLKTPFVIRAESLGKGKGVVVAEESAFLVKALTDILSTCERVTVERLISVPQTSDEPKEGQ